MAAIGLFSYQAATGSLHRLDPRIKLAALLALSAVGFLVSAAGVLAISLLLIAGWVMAAPQGGGQRLFAATGYAKRMLPLLVLALIMVGSRGITFSSAEAATLPVTWNHHGALAGADYAARFLLAAMLGDLFVSTTSRGRIIDTVSWLCGPLPRRARALVPLATAIALSSAPLIAGSILRTREACTVRGVRLRRHPRLLATVITRAALDQMPLRVNRISDATVVRGFGFDRTPAQFHLTGADALLSILTAATVVTSLVL